MGSKQNDERRARIEAQRQLQRTKRAGERLERREAEAVIEEEVLKAEEERLMNDIDGIQVVPEDGSWVVPMGTGEALAEQLKPYFDDRNGDGEVVVSVMEYTIGKDADSIADPNVQMANITKLSGDIDGGESMLFLVDDMEYFQEQYMLFAYNDGTSPAEGEKPDYARMGVRWGDCPALTSLELGASENFDGSQGYDYQTFLQDYKLVPRVYTGTKLEKDEDAAAYYEKAMSVFHTLTRQ